MRSYLQNFAVVAAVWFASTAAYAGWGDNRHAWFPISAAADAPPIIVGLHKQSHYATKTIRVLIVMHSHAAAESIAKAQSAKDYADTLLGGELFEIRPAEAGPWALPSADISDDEKLMMSMVLVPSRKDATPSFPPTGEYYNCKTASNEQYLWRWIGMHAPDLVVEVVQGDAEQWYVPKSAMPQSALLLKALPNARELPESNDLVPQLTKIPACNVGLIPAVRVVSKTPSYWLTLRRVLKENPLPPSPARLEIQQRIARTPEVIAGQLLEVYGKKLDSVQYIPALAIVGRLREDRILHGDKAPISPLVSAAVEPYLSSKKTALGPKAGGSDFAGHLLFGELAEITGDKRCVELVKAAADRAFDADGKPRDAMPAHNEMSDAVFMGCPILAQAGKLTGDEKYYDACLRNLLFMHKLCMREDGLYRHSPLDDAAWGRGNGFPALGLAWALSEIPKSYKDREKIEAMFDVHLTAMLPHQDRGGAWRQVVDKPDSYREFTVTAMTTYAMARGVRMGWLDRVKFAPAIAKGWFAIRARIGSDGGLVDVCTGTGKQKSLRDYYDRTAILGRDDRGGAMALMLTTEMQQYLKWASAQKQ